MFRFIAYGILLALLVYNAYFHFNGSSLLSDLFNNNKEIQLPSSLPPGVTAVDACRTLKSKYNLNMQSLLQASPSVKHYWEQLQCSVLTPLTIGGSTQERDTAPIFSVEDAMGNIVPAQQPTDIIKSSQSTTSQSSSATTHSISSSNKRGDSSIDSSSNDQTLVNNVLTSATDSTAATSPAILESMVRARCKKLRDKHGVQPGKSWGTLPLDMQKRWNKLGCDVMINTVDPPVTNKNNMNKPSDTSGGGVGIRAGSGSDSGGDASLEIKPPTVRISPKDLARIVQLTPKDPEYWNAPLISPYAMPAFNLEHKQWCIKTMQKYKVVPMKSWGSLPETEIPTWKAHKCDLIFTERRLALKPLPVCLKENKAGSQTNKPLPLIAVMAATTTRKVPHASLKNIALFVFLLPSLVRTLDCGYRYMYVMGYDIGDAFYDTPQGMSLVKQWFKYNIEDPLANNGISISLRPVRVNNNLKKPGPVFNEMARAAYKDGADYFYRVNDDTELIGHWADIFVKALHKYNPPVAIVGPGCSQGNQYILTHDFVARIHMDIFEMNYYPPDLKDWWMDDWISLVYGRKRTFKAKKAEVIHHVKHHGQRYEVDRANEHRVGSLVKAGRQKIHQWMVKQKVPLSEIKVFNGDQHTGNYEGNYQFSEP